MFGEQGKSAKAPTSMAMQGKKPAGKGVGLGAVQQGTTPKGIKGNKGKLK